ncbi:MAG: ABC transporter permease [Labedaea sp.]
MGRAGPYLRMLRAQVRAQTEYRTSFVVDLVASALATTLDLVTVFVLFRVRGELGGFGGREVLLMAGLSTCAFPIADLAVGSIDRLRYYVRSGLFDTVLIRPLSALGQLVAMDFAPRRVGRVVQGLLVYLIALSLADVPWTPARVLLAVMTPLAGAVLFASLLIAGATVAFWWVESGEIAASVTYGGKDFASYPITVYGGLFRQLFAFGLGFAFVGYLPALALLGRSDPLGTPGWLHWCAPLVAALAASGALLLWRTGIRHYRSTGS